MDLFGKKALAEVQRELNETLALLDGERKRCADLEKRERIALEKAKQFEDECIQLKARLKETQDAYEKVANELRKAEQMVQWLQEREIKNKEIIEKTENARKETEASLSRLREENERLSSEIAKLRRDITTRRESTDLVSQLRNECSDLRKKLAELEEKLKVALKKAEHNRRAYLVTQMQLDLAEDRLFFLTHGKPRPVISHPAKGMESPNEKIVAEDVEGYTEPDDGSEDDSGI